MSVSPYSYWGLGEQRAGSLWGKLTVSWRKSVPAIRANRTYVKLKSERLRCALAAHKFAHQRRKFLVKLDGRGIIGDALGVITMVARLTQRHIL